MSDIDNDNEQPLVQDELTTLKARADMLGVTYHPAIGLEKLKTKIAAALSDTTESPAAEDKVETAASEVETLSAKRLRLKRQANELVRIRVSCMNPAKSEWEGEIFTCGNSLIGSVKKFVPFNAEEGWHVPRIIFEQMKERQCQIFVAVRDARGNTTRKGKLIKEFAIEVLEPLTKEELHDLAQRQAMSKSIA